MKLLNSFVSPFAARVRMAIYAYDLPVAIVPSGQWTANYEKSPDYLAINPIGRVPTLIRDDGSALPESGVIVEYLADAFPKTGLRPGDAEAAANMRLMAHLAELYLQAPSGPLFGQLFSGHRDPVRTRACFEAMHDGLRSLDHFMAHQGTTTDAITLAECALVPFLFYGQLMARSFDEAPLLAAHPTVDVYWQKVRAHAASAKVVSEIREAVGNSPLKALVQSEAIEIQSQGLK